MLLMRYLKHYTGEEPNFKHGVLTTQFTDDELYVLESTEEAIDQLKSLLNGIENTGALDDIWEEAIVEKVKNKELHIVNFRRSCYSIKVIFTHIDIGDKVDLLSDVI